jgi:hypothetical protein
MIKELAKVPNATRGKIEGIILIALMSSDLGKGNQTERGGYGLSLSMISRPTKPRFRHIGDWRLET